MKLTIQIPLPTLRDPPSPLLLILLHHPNILQRLHHFPIHTPARIYMVRRSRAAVLSAAMHLAQTAHADRFAEIDMSGDGGGAGVEPGI